MEVKMENIYMVTFSIDYGIFYSDLRCRCIAAKTEMEAEKSVINLIYERLKKAHPDRIWHKQDIDVWKVEDTGVRR
jgi:hypothetical protein